MSDNASFLSVAVRICSRSSYLLSFIDIFAYNQQLTFLTHPVEDFLGAKFYCTHARAHDS